jgi:hypothetical protein
MCVGPAERMKSSFPLGFEGVEVLPLCDQPQVNQAGGGFGCLGGRVVFCESLKVE